MTTTDRLRLCLYSPASRGGAGWFVACLTRALAEAGAEVVLIAPELVPPEREPRDPNVRRRVLIAGRAGRGSTASRGARFAWGVIASFAALAHARWRTREVVVTLYGYLPVLVAQFLWLRLLGARITFVVHDATPHAWAFPASLRPVERWLQRLSYRLPYRIVSLTGALHAELARDWGRTARSVVIPHGAYQDGEASAIPGEGLVLLFGMLRRNKRIVEAIAGMRLAAADLPGWRLLIAGAPHAEDPGYWDECRRAIEDARPAVAAEVGFVPEDRVRALLARADAVLLPYEAFNSQSGVAVLAAFAERTVVATDAGGLAELAALGLATVPIVRPVTPEAIAAALRTLAAIPLDERRRSARASRARLAEALDWGRIGRAYLDLIRAG